MHSPSVDSHTKRCHLSAGTDSDAQPDVDEAEDEDGTAESVVTLQLGLSRWEVLPALKEDAAEQIPFHLVQNRAGSDHIAGHDKHNAGRGARRSSRSQREMRD